MKPPDTTAVGGPVGDMPAVGVSGEAVPPAFLPAEATPSIARTLKRQRRRNRSQKLFTVGIPVLFLLLFVGSLAAVMMTMNKPKVLAGTLPATGRGDEKLPPARITASILDLTPDEAQSVLSDFEADPAAFLSSQMQCRITRDGDSLSVTVSPGNGFQWFAVDPSANRDLLEWIREHRAALEKHRAQELEAAGTALCHDRLKQASGERVVLDAARYRDEFGLNAHCDAFGYAIEAFAENRVARCAHEDEQGRLYFALPESTVSFTLAGRALSDESLRFPGTYTVNVTGHVQPVDMEGSVDPSAAGSGDTTSGDDAKQTGSGANSDDMTNRDGTMNQE
ncbi:MAG: hypothetical protein R3C19_04420 [Planctomycetaceae bacterium]